MSLDFGEIRERMAEYLISQGIDAVCAYPEEKRLRRTGAVAAVSLRACQGGPGGFQDYLGERWDEESGQWQELYGTKLIGYYLNEEKDWGLDMNELETRLEEAKAKGITLKGMVIINPGNPTGMVSFRAVCDR